MGPNIEISEIGDENEVGIEDCTGLNIMPEVICPHYTNDEKERVDGFRKKYSVVTLTDEEALLVDGDEKRVIQ